jgi:peptide/nickel transport system permease protein
MSGARLLRYVLRRLLQAIPVVLGVVVLNFLPLQLAPGDAATVLAGEAGGAPAEYVQQLRERFGLDKPLLVQLVLYIKNILALDLGYSFRNTSPVLPLILARLLPTLLLMGTTLLVSVAGGTLLRLLAAIWVRTWKDHVISVAAIIAYAMPLFWIGLMLILIFAIKLDWLPTSGMEDAAAFYEGWERIVDIARHLILPTMRCRSFTWHSPHARRDARTARPRLRYDCALQRPDRAADHPAAVCAERSSASGYSCRRASG